MQHKKISEILIYPIKSTKGYSLQETIVENIGLKYDRNFAIINAEKKVLTARENPNILKIATRFSNSKLTLTAIDEDSIVLDTQNLDKIEDTVTLFKDKVSAKIINHKVNNWISLVLGESSKLIEIDANALRTIKPKYNGKENDFIAFNDVSPIHLISEESLQDLNSKLIDPIIAANFRPNIVVTGCKPYEEKSWNTIQIGECIYDVAIATERCSFSTINPITRKKDSNQEPLRTLSKNRKKGENVNFGIYLTPRKLGIIKLDDELKIIEWK